MNQEQSHQVNEIREFHLFAGIGGGIYGGHILQHKCCGGVEIDLYCQSVLKQRQQDGWMDNFPIFSDITKLDGNNFRGKFDILCGGFPCQAFSYAAHGNNIEAKNLWPEMFRFTRESDAPIVFGENVTVEAIETATNDLLKIGYTVAMCRLACMDINADHKRPRFWLLAVKNRDTLNKVINHDIKLPKLCALFWQVNPHNLTYPVEVPVLAPQKRGIGNAQAPIAAAVAFEVLLHRHMEHNNYSLIPSKEEITAVYNPMETWMKKENPNDPIYIHTPTTMGNYHYKSMMKHPSCAKYVRIFGKPTALHAEYLMGFPIGASSPSPLTKENFDKWNVQIYCKD